MSLDWYESIIDCHKDRYDCHNYIPVSFVQNQYTKQATTLMCSHCLQIIELKDVQEFNSMANSLSILNNA